MKDYKLSDGNAENQDMEKCVSTTDLQTAIAL